MRTQNRKKRKRIGRSVQIGRRSSVAANSGAEARDDSDHYEDQRRHQETHVDSLPFQIPIRENEFLPRIKKKMNLLIDWGVWLPRKWWKEKESENRREKKNVGKMQFVCYL